MSTSLKLAGFAAALAVIFGGAVAAGGAIDPDRGQEDTVMSSTAHAPQGGGAHEDATNRGQDAASGHGEEKSAGAHGAHGGAAAEVRGLSVSDGGLRVVVDDPELARGRQERLSFRIEDADGTAVRDFDLGHERRMHLIVVRRDLSGFQHLHPTMAADGTWSTDLTLPEAGSYRLFADFSHEGEARTLASDLRVDGPANLLDLPAPASVAASDGGDRVELDGGHAHGGAPAPAHAGEETALRFAITRAGKPVEVEPYLGASGHLVALREGDLAFLHVHPSGEGVRFETAFPTPGRYRLFLQYKVDGRVQTAAFTQEVAR